MRNLELKHRSVIDYVVACVNDFADTHNMNKVDGFDYLNKEGGIDFLVRNYDVEHSYSIEDAVSDMAMVCRRNGGKL